jgi:hypothetical protein
MLSSKFADHLLTAVGCRKLLSRFFVVDGQVPEGLVGAYPYDTLRTENCFFEFFLWGKRMHLGLQAY